MARVQETKKGKRHASPATTTKKASTEAPRPAPAFLSSLNQEEVDFPRGGGSSLTALELKQTRDEGRREADAEAATSSGRSGKRRQNADDRNGKRRRKTDEAASKQKENHEDTIRVEQLSYKRLIPGTRVLARVHTILPLHLILSLPNNLLAHVPITEVSNKLTSLLTAEEAASDEEGDDDNESQSSSSGSPDLSQLFTPGQYFSCKVINTYPTASQSFISQYPVSETTRLAARTEVSLIPEKVNSEISKTDLRPGYMVTGEVLSEEDKGWRVSLGLSAELGGADIEGWISKDGQHDVTGSPLIAGQLITCTVKEALGAKRVVQLSIDHDSLRKAQLQEVSDVGSILPGHLTSVLVTAVVPSGLNVKVCGFFDGTVDLAHLGLGAADIDDKFKVGKKIRARVLYDNINATPRHFSLSVLPHILNLSSATTSEETPLEEAVQIGKVYNSVTVVRVIPEWGLICMTNDGLEGFVHISHISDDRLYVLAGNNGPYKVGTLHRARVIGHSPLDGVLLMSFEQKVLDQVFMQVGELTVGQVLKGTIRKLTDKGLFVNIHGSVDGAVWPLHYADIRLKHPEKRFKVDSTVRARVFALEPERNRVILTLKKSLVDSELKVPLSTADVAVGDITPAVVSKILDKGCIVDLFGGSRAFIPMSEASESFVTNLGEIFYVGKPVNVKVTEIDSDSGRLVASVRQALPTALAAEKIDIGDSVHGVVSQVHAEQVLLTLQPSQLNALLSLSNLSHHRAVSIEDLRATLKPGEELDDLTVVSKNPTTGLLIVANKRTPVAKASTSASTSTASGISKPARGIDAMQPGQVVTGHVVSHTPQGTMVQLTSHIRGRIHPCDEADDLSLVAGEKRVLKVDDDITAYVLSVNRSSRMVELSTRQSRLKTKGKEPARIVDPEISSVKDLEKGQKVRGLVKNIANHGVFVTLARDITARVMIKELFDEYVKDWQSRFEVNQLVAGTITSIDKKKGFVEMTLKKNPSKTSTAPAKLGFSDFSPGQTVTATIKKVESYGLFLRVEGSDISGLCHRSELSDNKRQDVSKALNGFREGDQVKAYILEVDEGKRRINFSIKPSRFASTEDSANDDIAGSHDEDAEGDKHDDEDEDEEMASDEGEGEGDEDQDGEERLLAGLLNGDADESDDGSDSDEALGMDEDENDDDDSGGEDDEAESEEEPEVGVTSAPARQASAGKSNAISAGGFDWNGDDQDQDAESSGSSSEDDDEENAPKRSKSKGKQKANYDLASSAPDSKPESATDFERALLASPNSSFLWMQYMSFLLQLHEIDRARKIGRQALSRIGFREEEEKLNIWMALINLELGFGTLDSAEKIFKEAAEYNDKKTVYLRYAEALGEAGKHEGVEECYTKAAKKFSQHPDIWLKYAEWYFKQSRLDDARELLPRSMKSLDKSKHVEIIEKFGILEFRHGDMERGKTLFEELVDRYKKRLDLWSVYIDQLASKGDIQTVRGVFDRVLDQKLTSKKAKFLFKKWLAVENRIGDAAGQEKAKERAREWVAANAQAKEDADEDEE